MSGIPGEVLQAVEAAWRERLGRTLRVTTSAAVGGGCISPSARLETDAGAVAFLKWGEPGDTPVGLFAAEGASLAALRAAAALRTPEVLAVGEDGAGWLLLEWLAPARATRATWEELGRGLAALHATRGPRFGWPADNFIGSLPQANGWMADWAAFWRERRLAPQLELAYSGGYFAAAERRRFERLRDALPELLDAAAEDGSSLLHGDLWSGNIHVTTDGTPALLDPASYYGHREVDLAMSALFGGFDPGFYTAYAHAWPLAPGYEPVRRAVYQLYYLLVHVNLFGGGYVRSTLSALAQAGF